MNPNNEEALAMSMSTRDTLLAYSEWLDGQGLVKSDSEEGADKRSHEDLASEFIEQWDGRPLAAGRQV